MWIKFIFDGGRSVEIGEDDWIKQDHGSEIDRGWERNPTMVKSILYIGRK